MTAFRRRAHLPLALIAGALLLLPACGGGNDSAGTTTASPTPSSSPTGGARTPGAAETPIDGAAFLTVYGAGDGTFPSDQPGLAVGDFNDDGIDDFAAGARFADPPSAEDAGQAYVIFGSERLPTTLDLAAAGQYLTISGPGLGAALGFSAAAGDLNGDGVADLILGAPFTATEGQQTGAVYVFFGPLGPGAIDLSAAAAGVTLTGPGAGSFFGDSVTTGDVNGDGTADLVVGSTFAAEAAHPPGGAVFTYFGRPDWPAAVATDSASAVLYAADQFDELGDFVRTGDVNADGIADIVATAEAADGPANDRNTAAEVHVLFGRRDLADAYRIADGQANLSVYGAVTNDTLGFSLEVADLDGDGAADIAMSAHLAADSKGIVYILRGGPNLSGVVDLAQPPDGVIAITGEAVGDLLATSLASVNSSLVMGAGFADANGLPDAGAVYVLPPGLPTGGMSAAGAHTYVGGAASSRLGANIAPGDINGDGSMDLVIIAELAPGPDASRPNAGRIYVVTP